MSKENIKSGKGFSVVPDDGGILDLNQLMGDNDKSATKVEEVVAVSVPDEPKTAMKVDPKPKKVAKEEITQNVIQPSQIIVPRIGSARLAAEQAAGRAVLARKFGGDQLNIEKRAGAKSIGLSLNVDTKGEDT